MRYRKPSWLHYRIAQLVCTLFSWLLFRCKVIRNEIRGVKGPFVVIANHQAAYDFANLFGRTRRMMSFVISNSFYHSLPITSFLDKLGVIPKQQFQTTVTDMKNMKAVIDAGEPLVIYPAGLMCEDGLSTPIPPATYKFLKWLGVDIYVARTYGTYFAMPKWSSGIRCGRTYLDVYKLMDAETLATTDLDSLRDLVNNALMYDAYREQENARIPYARNQDIRGLEGVLYLCPHCGAEFSMQVRDKSTIFCTQCGYEQKADRLGFLHNEKGLGPEIRYVSDWSKLIYSKVDASVRAGELQTLSCTTQIHMIDYQKHKFYPVGCGTVTLYEDHFHLQGTLHGEEMDMKISIAGLPTLPFSPGKYFEIQDGKNIYRCVLDDGSLVMKFINLVKIYYAHAHKMAQPIQ